MRCAWQALLQILPLCIRSQVDDIGKDSMQELRLRLGQVAQVVHEKGVQTISHTVVAKDLAFVINTASSYSPWNAETMAQGYLTASGGHRIGLCGRAVVEQRKMRGIRDITALCIRVARDFPGIGKAVPQTGSLLLLGPPGSGKTTLLRDIIRTRAERNAGSIGVVDERGELFPFTMEKACFQMGNGIDIMTGCSKEQGILTMLRTMSPSIIAVDEITRKEDAYALHDAFGCGVDIIATAHGYSKRDLYTRPVYAELVSSGVFQNLLVLGRDKSWKLEPLEG